MKKMSTPTLPFQAMVPHQKRPIAAGDTWQAMTPRMAIARRESLSANCGFPGGALGTASGTPTAPTWRVDRAKRRRTWGCYRPVSGREINVSLADPLALLRAPLLVGAAQLPVPAGRERLRGQPALGHQVAPQQPDGRRLAVNEGVALAGRELQRLDRVQL